MQSNAAALREDGKVIDYFLERKGNDTTLGQDTGESVYRSSGNAVLFPIRLMHAC